MSLVLDGLISFACLALSLLLFVTKDDDLSVPLSPSAYILFGSVTHARLLPQRSQHAFTYPMLTFLFSLSDLDAGKLSLLRGWLFSYNGKFFSVLRLRASNYLYRDHKEKSIREKLVKTLERFGVSDAAQLSGAWMMTMPRYLGWNATNALTVYYCYKKGEDKLWLAVFEVHNNFGERHVHVLQAGINEEIPPKGFDHQWTVPRNFHASPTNDRSGAYTFALRAVPPPPSSTSPPAASAIKPVVLTDYHDCPPGWTPGKDKGPLKLRVVYRTTRPAPLSTPALLYALAVYPFTLALVLPRTIYQALVLHYRRGVTLYRRPEMKPQWDGLAAPSTHVHQSGGVAWQRPTRIEAFAARLVLRFIARQAGALNIAVTLRAGDPATPTRTFAPAQEAKTDMVRTLTISYLSPRLFTLLLAAPDAQSALACGGPQASRGGEVAEFVVSDAGLFAELFAVRRSAAPWGVGMLRWLRRLHPRAAHGMEQEDGHKFLEPDSVAELVHYLVVVGLCVAMEWVGWVIWGETGVKFVLDETRT